MLKNKNVVMKFIKISIFLILSLFFTTVVLGYARGGIENKVIKKDAKNGDYVFDNDRVLVKLETKNDYTALITDKQTTYYGDGNKYNNYIYIQPSQFVHATSLDNKASFCISESRKPCDEWVPYYVCRIKSVHPGLIELLEVAGALDAAGASNGNKTDENGIPFDLGNTNNKLSQQIIWDYVYHYSTSVATSTGSYLTLPSERIGYASNGSNEDLIEYVAESSPTPEAIGKHCRCNDDRIKELKEKYGISYSTSATLNKKNGEYDHYLDKDTIPKNISIKDSYIDSDGNVCVEVESEYYSITEGKIDNFLVYTNSSDSDDTKTIRDDVTITKLEGNNKYKVVIKPWDIGSKKNYKFEICINYHMNNWNVAILSNSANENYQNILLAEKTNEPYKLPGSTGEVVKNTNISLQKYIVKVNGQEVTNGNVEYHLRGDVNGDGKKIDYNDIKLYIAEKNNKIKNSKLSKKDENERYYIADLDNNGVIGYNDYIIAYNMATKFTSKEYYYFDDNGNVQYCLADSIETKTDLRKNTVLRPTPNGDLDEKNCYEYGYWNSSIPNATSGLEAKYPKSVYSYKQLNPVKIKVGDEVTYKITVYNNSNVDATNVVLRDAIVGLDYIDVSGIKVTGIENGEVFNLNQGESDTYKKLYITLNKLPKNSERDIYVTLKYNKGYYNGVLNNEVQIASTVPENKTEYRTYDGDSIVFKKPAVSLEKFVSQIYSNDEGWKGKELSGTNPDDVTTYNRSGKRYNYNAVDKSNEENYNKWKNDHAYPVENGDKVIFTIRVKNTGEIPISITKLLDTYTNINDSEAENKMIYEGIVSAIQYTSSGEKKNKDFAKDIKLDRSESNDYVYLLINKGEKIAVEDEGIKLETNEYVDIKVKFRIESYANSINDLYYFNNMAYIEEITDTSREFKYADLKKYDNDGIDNNQDEDSVKLKEYKVSLEKFVTKVQSPATGDSVELKNNVTNEWTRAGKRYNVALLNKPDKQTRENFNTYKVEKENVVSLENGDDITFTIRLSNTGNNKVKITKIDDWHSSELTLKNKETDKYSAETIDDGTGKDPHEEITFKNPVLLDPDKYVDIQIIYNIKAEKNNTKEDFYNKAKINELQNKNNCKAWDCDGPDNNQDEDHVKLKKYKVSLEKYVTEVTDANEGNKQTYTDREYKRYNESAGTAANKDGFKKSQAVQLEAGDLVTFTIKIKNEDTTEREKNTDIYVKKITDIPISKNKDNSLEYLENSIGATVIKNKDGSLTVKLPDKNGEKISAQQCYTFTMTFKVNVSTINTQTVQDFSNKAKVTNIYNKNTLEVNDSDGADNNADEDFIKTKVYTVSLEKYIEKVVLSNREVKDGFNREGLAEHKYNKDLEGYKDDTLPTPGEKYNNVVKADCGSKITYVIKIKNDGDTKVRITGVQDYLPAETTMYQLDSYTEKNSVYDKYNRRIYIVNLNDTERKEKGYYTSDASNDQDNKAINSYNRNGIELEPGGTKEFKVTITTKASNLSLDVYRNEAQLNYIENRNKLKVMDTTPKDNKDRDYFKMDSPTKTPIDICVHKVWENVSEREIPNRITVRLKNKKTGAEVKNATLNKDNGWRVVWTDLDKDIEYDVTEDTVAGFNKKIVKKSEYEYEITNTKKDTPSPEKTSVYVEKKWSDSDNKYGKRPNSVEVALYQDGKQYNNLVKTLSASNSWNGNWENLPKFDNNDGHEYKYTVQELNKSSGYETSIEQISKQGYSIAFKITNKYTGKETEKVSKTVTKIWDDDNEKYEDRPTSIKVGLYANGNETGKTATLNSSNSWTYIWNDLEKYSDGQEIVYTVKEIGKINNYIVKYDSNTECDTITNIYNKTHISVYKEWDVQDQSLIKPVNVTLYRNGTALSTAELNEDNSWNHTWDNLDVYDNNLNKYTYTIQETTLLENIESCIRGSGDKYTIINKQIDDEDPIIAGIVWNDVGLDKTSASYNGQYDEAEQLLEGIQVYLYREGVGKAVAKTTTDSKGYYRFRNIDLAPNVITDPTERYIKAKVSSTTDNKWNKTSGYYSYTVVFEYDGIKYTSTFDSTGNRIWNIDDNSTDSQYAKPQYSNAEEGITDRIDLNNSFSTIDNTKDITYETINEKENLPQSRYTYNSNTMSITSSTNTINIAEYKDKELTLQHVNLGLRGRDTLDLELTSDVFKVDVTVNGKTGTYNHKNEVKIAKADIGVWQDAANITNERYTDRDGNDINLENINNATVNQKVRTTDITNDHYKDNATGLGIKVTYKITVLNSGVTDAKATQVINYYDSKYSILSANDSEGKALETKLISENGVNGYKITTNSDFLKQGEATDIYVTYKLIDPVEDFRGVDQFATYNMSEIYQYESRYVGDLSEFTRGLIDVDSAPGSANTEKARLTGNETDNNTTAQYYFNANNLKELKFEDDTYTTPVLYFVKDSSERTLTGNVFEDLTTPVSDKVRTGDGIQKEELGELNIKGVEVRLCGGNIQSGKGFTAETQSDGSYSFSGFLPGDYYVQFIYGKNKETVLINAAGDGKNTKSFNGVDYQATNNTGTYGAKKISSRANYWYLDNETPGISTATDIVGRRKEVSDWAYNNFDKMKILNKIKERKNCI